MALAGNARATVVDWDPAGNQSNTGGPGTWDLALPAHWNNAGTDQLWVNANLDIARFGTTAGTVTLGTGITAGGLTFNVDGMIVTGNTLTLGGATPTINVAGAATATISSTLAGTAGAVVAGGGTLILTQANSISGPWDIQAGTVQANNYGAFGTSTVAVDTGATLLFNAGAGTLTNALTLNGGTLTQQAAAQLTTQGLITVSAASTINVALADPGKIFVSGAGITGSGALTKNGGGILQLTVASAGYSGNWTLNGGFVEVQNTSALGSGTVTVNTGAELVASGSTVPNNVVIGSAGGILGFDNGPFPLSNLAGSFNGTVNAANDFSVGLRDFYNQNQTRNGRISGVISGSGAMTVLNPTTPAQLTLTGNNSGWSGAINVPSNVQLRAVVGGSGNALGTGAQTINGSLLLITTPTITVIGSNPGFSGRYYNGGALLPNGFIGGFDYGLVAPVGTRDDAQIDFAYNGVSNNFSPIPAVAGLNGEHVAALWTGILNIATGGSYTFTTASDDGSLLYIDGQQLVQNDQGQGTTARSGVTTVAMGLHSIIVKFANGTGPGGIIANYSGPDTVSLTQDVMYGGVRIGAVANSVTNTGSQILGTNIISTPVNLGASGTGGFDLAGTNTTVTGAVTLGNNLAVAVTGVTGSELLTLAGPVTLNGAHTFTIGLDQVANGAQNASAGADVVISGNIGEVPASGSTLTKTGPRTLTLSGTNSFTGATTVINGVLQLNSPVPNSSVGPGGLVINPTAGPVIVRLLTNEQLPNAAALAISSVGNNTAVFDLNGFTETLGGVNITGTANSATGVTTGATGNLIVGGDIFLNNNRVSPTNTGREVLITGTGSYSVAASNGTLNLGAVLRNITVASTNIPGNLPGSDATIETAIVNGGINKLGTQKLILNGASTYAGGTVINDGAVRAVGANGATSSVLGTGLVTLKGGSLEVRNNGTGSNGTITYGNDVSIDASQLTGLIDVNNNGANTGNNLSFGNLAIGAQTLNVTGGNSYGLRFSSVTLSGDATVNLTTAGSSLTLNNVGQSGVHSLTKSATSPGVLILTGNGTFTGGTTVPFGSGPLRLVPSIGTTDKPAGTGAISLATGTTLQITPTITMLSNTGALAGVLSAKFYNGTTTIAAGNYGAIPTASTTVALLADGSFFNRPAALTSPSTTNLLAVYSGLLNVTVGGAYTFQTAAQDESQLVIDGVPVISVNTGGGTQSLTDSATSAPVTLGMGLHTIVMKAYTGSLTGGGFRVRYAGGDTGGNMQLIAPAQLSSVPALTNVGNTGAPVTLAAAANISLDGVGSDLNSSVSTLTLGAGSVLNAVNAGGSGALSVAGVTTLQGAATFNPTSALLNLVGNLADGGGNFAVTKTGAGTLVLTGAKTFGGTLTITSGGVQVTDPASLGGVANGTVVSVGATLDLNGIALGLEPLNLSGAGTGTSAAALYNSSSTPASAGGPVTLAAATTVGGFGDLTLGGPLTGSATLTKTGVATLTLSGGNGGFTGVLAVTQGIVKLGSATALGTAAGNTTVSSGAVLDLNGQTITEPLTLAGVGLANIGAANTLGALINTSGTPAVVNATVGLGTSSSIGSSSLTGGGAITLGGVVGGGIFNKVGGNTVTMTAANTYTGVGTVQLGTLVLSGAGTVATENSMVVNPTATLTLDDTGTNNITSSRLGSKKLILIGANFNILGNAVANTLEDIGAGLFNADSANSLVTLTPGATKNVQFKAASLKRDGNFTQKGTLLFRGTALGANTAASLTANSANILFTTAPTGVAAFGQAGAAGSPNRGIVPWALADTTLGGPGSSFATYSAANGVQVLQAGDFAATLIATNNVVTSAALTAPAGGLTINSLTLKAGGGLTIGAGNNITLDSGGVLATASATIGGAGILTATLAPPSTTLLKEIIIHTAGTVTGTILTISTPIATTGGLTKAGDGKLILGAQNTFTGAVRLNGGTTTLAGGANTIFFASSSVPLGSGASPLKSTETGNNLFVDAGATLDLFGNDQRVGGLGGLATSVATAVGVNFSGTSGTITNTGALANFRFSKGTGLANYIPTVLAGNLNIQRDGTGTMFFFSPNTYTGTTLLTGGVTVLQDAGSLSTTGLLNVRRAVLRLDDTGLQTATRLNASAPVALDGGAIVFVSRSGGTADVLNLGALTLSTGASLLTQNLGGGGTAATGTSTVNIASLARSLGATINFTATANNNVQLGDNPRVLLGVAPVLANGLVGGWATTQGYNSANPASGNASFDFATYDPVAGFRPTAYTGVFGAGSNVNVEPSGTNGPATVTLAAGNTAANSLRIGGLGNTTTTTLVYDSATDVLNLASGGLLNTGNNNARFIGAAPDAGLLTAGGGANTGTVELFIHNAAPSASALTINAGIVNNPNGAQVAVVLGGLSQGSTTQLNGSNTYTGTTYVNGLNVNLNSPALAIPGNLIISGGTSNGTDSQASTNQTVKLLASNQISTLANVTVNGGGMLSLNGFSNTISNLTLASDGGGAGNIGPVVQTGITALAPFTGALTLSGNITATSLMATAVPVISGNVTLPVGTHTVAIGAVPGAPGQVGLEINAAMTGGGSLNVTSGVLGLGNTVSTASLNLSAGTTLVLTSLTSGTVTPTINALTGPGSVNVNVSGTAQVQLVVGNGNGSGTFTGTITGPISLSKVGTGTETLTKSVTLNSLSVTDGGELEFIDNLPFAPFAPEPKFEAGVVPEPGSLGLLLVGAVGLLARRRRG